jgi:hypothetical protein
MGNREIVIAVGSKGSGSLLIVARRVMDIGASSSRCFTL